MSDANMLEMYSAALDEIYRLRTALAYEARVVEAHYEWLKSFPKSRLKYAVEQVARMRSAAAGDSLIVYAGTPSRSLESARDSVGMRGLSRGQWEASVS